MNSYPTYKDSGVEWIGKIPSSWDIKRNKYITTPKKNKSEVGNEELLSVSEYLGVVPRSVIRKGEDHLTRSESLEGYLKVSKGDLVNNIMLMWKKGLGVSKYDGIVSPSYSVFRFNNSIPTYHHYLFRTELYITEFRKNSTGVILSRLRLYDDDFGDIYSYLPPLPEQTQIVSFLDTKTQKIDDLIHKTEKKIELLKEKRTSLINHCVTKGLNPNVEMKDSGVEWIGEIPSGWDKKKLKYFSTLFTEKEDTNKDDIKISPENVESYTGVCFNLYSEYEGKGVPFKSGDILLNKLRLYLVKILLPDYDGFSMGEMIVIRVNENVSNKYYFYLLFNQGLIDLLDSQSTGIKVPRVSPEIIMGSYLPYPPKDEQTQIVEYLDEQTQKIDTTIEKETQRIELLKEYRQSLISEVVTGKIDVRDYNG